MNILKTTGRVILCVLALVLFYGAATFVYNHAELVFDICTFLLGGGILIAFGTFIVIGVWELTK